MRRIIDLLNTMPTVKSALVMGGMMFAASVAGGMVARHLSQQTIPQVRLNCVCVP